MQGVRPEFAITHGHGRDVSMSCSCDWTETRFGEPIVTVLPHGCPLHAQDLHRKWLESLSALAEWQGRKELSDYYLKSLSYLIQWR